MYCMLGDTLLTLVCIVFQLQKEMGRIFREMPPSEKAKYQDRGTSSSKRPRIEVEESGEPSMERLEVQTRCFPKRVCEALSSSSEAQKEMIRSFGFGSFLDMDYPMVRSGTIAYLIACVDTEASTINFHGRSLKLTPTLFQSIMGVGDGGQDVVPHDVEVSPVRDAILGGKVRIQVVDLIQQIKDSTEADEMFIIRVVLLILGTVLVPKSGEYVHVEYVSVLSDVTRISKRNWATYSLNFLLEQIKGFRKRGTKYMPGCTIFLQVSRNE